MKPLTTYERFVRTSPAHCQLVRKEEFVLEVTEALTEAMETRGVRPEQLARKLGKSPAAFSRILAGHRQLTLRRVAEVADALGCRPTLRLEPLRRS